MRTIAAAALIALAACYPDIPTPPPPVDGSGCSSAELRLRTLACSWSDGFARKCSAQAGRGLRIDTACLVDSGSCLEAARCH